MSTAPFVWIDLEMTGLDPAIHSILQASLIITDATLKPVLEPKVFIIHNTDAQLSTITDWSKDHYTALGLLEKVKNSTLTLHNVEEEIMQSLRSFCTPQECYMCGNSVHMDWLFLKKYMPTVTDFLHYRLVDVSSLKVLHEFWYKNLETFRGKEIHDALKDIQESITELEFYRNQIFK